MKNIESLQCPGCKQVLKEYQFKSHLRNCKAHPKQLQHIVKRLSKSYSYLEVKLMIAELDICREKLEDEVIRRKNYVRGSNVIEEEPQMPIIVEEETVKCQKCKKEMYANLDVKMLFYVEQCWHLFCITCIVKHINDHFVEFNGNLECLKEGCKRSISREQVEMTVGKAEFQKLEIKSIRNVMNMVECVNCKSEYVFAVGNSRDAPSKNETGKILNEQAKVHYAQNRFVCQKPDCKSEQCKNCSSIPYHIGFTCQEFKKYAELKKCRYCDEPLNKKNQLQTQFKALSDICKSKECELLSKRACTKIHPCGHSCCGYRNQANCLPCLQEQCAKNNNDLNQQTGEDYCNICFIEGLSSAPCVRSTCGHIFHQKCLLKRFEVRWLTPRIFLNFCLCPLCKKWINLPQDSILAPQIINNTNLLETLKKKSLQRLKFEECQKDERLVNPTSPYYNKPVQYAMAIYAYFQCFKCKKPYFGGRKNCADAMNGPRDPGVFDAKELICPNCCQIPTQNCPKHGMDFIQFKCKFCCSIAQWFCWGTTHFCEPCHKRQCNGDYVSKYSKDKLPKCEGAKKCPIGGNHNGNGEERTLGCAICRNFKENSKNF